MQGIKVPSFKPLSLPRHEPKEAGALEQILRLIPILGWTIANELEKRRLAASLNELARQLADRHPTHCNWAEFDARQRALAQFISDRVIQAFGWPNGHFIPSDPFQLILFGDDGAGVDVFNDIEDYLGLSRGRINNQTIAELSKHSFGYVVEALTTLLDLDADVADDLHG